MKRKEIKRTAISAILCAFSVVVLFIGTIFDMVDITSAAIASGAVAFSVLELGKKYPVLIFAVTSLLSLLLYPSSSASIFYIAFLGYYPIIKLYIEKIKGIFSVILKLVVFNGAFIAIFCIFKSLFLSQEAESSKVIIVLLIIFANIFFIVYDIALNVLITAYKRFFRKKWGIDRFLDF